MTPPVLLAVAALLLAATARADNVSVSPMLEFPFPPSGNIPAEGDKSKLTRNPQVVEIEVDTSGLDPLSPYTIWAVIFNEPRFCHSSPCSPADLAFVPGHDPRVRSSIVNASTGGMVDADGRGKFFGEVWETRKGIVAAENLFGPGLLNTRRAEIQIIVRGHGQPTGGLAELFEAISSYTGGCNDANAVQPPCEDQQVSIHMGR